MVDSVISPHESLRLNCYFFLEALPPLGNATVRHLCFRVATSPQAIVNLFQRWYRHLGFVGCSSHSGRRAVEDIELTALHSYAGQESGNHLVARADLADVPLIDQAIWKIRPVRPRGFRDELIRHEHVATGEPVADGRPAAAGERRYNLEVPRSDCCRISAIEYDR
jgi:hypothetical protein